MESDRSYLETRRITQYIDKLQYMYNLNGGFHTVIFVFLFLLHIGLLICSAVYLASLPPGMGNVNVDQCLRPTQEVSEKRRMLLGNFLFGLIPLSFLTLGFSCLGFAWTFVQMFCMKSTNILYRIFRWTFIAYILSCIFAVVQSILATVLVTSYHNVFEFCLEKEVLLLHLTRAELALSVIVLLLMLIHLIAVFSLMRFRCSQFMWEWVFCDLMYMEQCGCIKRHVQWNRASKTAHGGPTATSVSYEADMVSFDSMSGESVPARPPYSRSTSNVSEQGVITP